MLRYRCKDRGIDNETKSEKYEILGRNPHVYSKWLMTQVALVNSGKSMAFSLSAVEVTECLNGRKWSIVSILGYIQKLIPGGL